MDIRRAVTEPVSGASLAVVRSMVGVVGMLSAFRIVRYGWIEQLYTGPSHRFTYLAMAWVPQPSTAVMTAIVAAMAVGSLSLALGRAVRPAGAVVLVAFGWTEMIDVTTYLNHYWFLTLVLVLGLVMPWDGRPQVARGWVWLMRFQMAMVYCSAGLAKLQTDWLVRAEPLRLWLPPRSGMAVIGPLLAEPTTAHVLSVAGAVFDCSVVPLLLWKRTRPFAWAALVAFHVSTWLLFPIGVFPWLMIGASTVFFDPDWPLRVKAWLATRVARDDEPEPDANHSAEREPTEAKQPAPIPRWLRTAGAVAAVGWVVVQVALPLRHYAYTGDHRWSGQGYRFAWNVLLVEKSGSVTFLVHDPAAGTTRADDARSLYTHAQIQVMSTEPDLIHQAALEIARREKDRGRAVEVRADAWMSMNGGAPARLIDPEVDLAAQSRDLWDDRWILPRPDDPS